MGQTPAQHRASLLSIIYGEAGLPALLSQCVNADAELIASSMRVMWIVRCALFGASFVAFLAILLLGGTMTVLGVPGTSHKVVYVILALGSLCAAYVAVVSYVLDSAYRAILASSARPSYDWPLWPTAIVCLAGTAAMIVSLECLNDEAAMAMCPVLVAIILRIHWHMARTLIRRRTD